MKQNMGSIDRLLRTIIAITLIVLYFTHIISGTIGIVLLVLAAVFLLTSLMGHCPLYTLFGLNTCAVKERNA